MDGDDGALADALGSMRGITVVLVNSPVAPVTPSDAFPGLPLVDLVQNFYVSNVAPNT